MAKSLKIDGKSDKIKRVWIPKPTSEELRPVGIPTMRDRAKQALALLAMEPEWEAKFEPNSYGFRPGRSSLDAIEAVHSSINKKPKFVLHGDIRKCFDRINHDKLLGKVSTFPMMNRQLRSWLKAGIVDGSEEMFPKVLQQLSANAGTPQGGVISPLLSNIALHGMEDTLLDWVESIPARNPGGSMLSRKARRSRMTIVRYADDFVILHPDLKIIEEARLRLGDWLKPLGLELHPEKTSIKHTLLTHESKPGFNFLGFWIRNYPVNRREEAKRNAGYRTSVRPHPDNISRVLGEIRKVLRTARDARSVVQSLQPIISGWSNYFRTVASKRTFSALDRVLMAKLMNWARKRHPRRTREWIRNRYLHLDGSRKRFGYLAGASRQPGARSVRISAFIKIKAGLKYFTETGIVRHTKVTGTPYDGNWVYWTLRGRDTIERRVSLQKLIRNQRGL
jgi:RNA-directed DNA polymerase